MSTKKDFAKPFENVLHFSKPILFGLLIEFHISLCYTVNVRKIKADYYLLIILILILVCGAAADYLVKNALFILIIVEDLPDVIKTLLGIQATVAVLSFSLLSIIASYTDKSYWGILIADFYSNKKNKIFKSKFVISLGLFFILLSFFSLLFELYNFIIAVFIATMIIILWQTHNIYSVFKGDSVIQKDIENMFLSEFEKKNNTENKIELFNTFCNGWRKIILEQSEIDFEVYKLDFLNFIDYLLKEQNLDCINCVCNNARRLSISLLISSTEIKKQQGILFLRTVYQIFWLSIDKTQTNSQEYMKDFEIISNITKEFLEALKSLPKEWLNNNFDWYVFTSYIDTIAITYQTKSKQQEQKASLRIALLMGLL